MKSLVYSISVLLGFFLTVSIYLLNKLQPSVISNNRKQKIMEHFETKSTQKYIPKYPYNLMLFTTFNRSNQIKGNKWYDEDVKSDNTNTLAYLTYTGSMQYTDDEKNNVKTAKLKNVELKGPLALYFANDRNSYEVNEFTILFMMKYNEITGNHTLFEMLCNTLSKGDALATNPNYYSQVISINVSKQSANKVKFTVIIGTSSASTGDIDVAVIQNNKPVLVSLSYDKSLDQKQVKLKIDKHTSEEFTILNDNKNTILAGSSPVIINKGGEIDCEMYSMAYYTKKLIDSEIDEFKAYNDYYIDGISSYDAKTEASSKTIQDMQEQQKDSQRKIEKLESTLQKCIQSSVEESSTTKASTSEAKIDDELSKIGNFDIVLPSELQRNRMGF